MGTFWSSQSRAGRDKTSIRLVSALAAAAALATASTAHAVDGCLALLCFAAPSWSAIQQCVPPVQQVLSDLAHGKPFPTCNMAGAGNSASHQWSSVPVSCPPQYIGLVESESGCEEGTRQEGRGQEGTGDTCPGCGACRTGQDHPQPSGCVAVSDGQQALTSGSLESFNPAAAGFFPSQGKRRGERRRRSGAAFSTRPPAVRSAVAYPRSRVLVAPDHRHPAQRWHSP